MHYLIDSLDLNTVLMSTYNSSVSGDAIFLSPGNYTELLEVNNKVIPISGFTADTTSEVITLTSTTSYICNVYYDNLYEDADLLIENINFNLNSQHQGVVYINDSGLSTIGLNIIFNKCNFVANTFTHNYLFLGELSSTKIKSIVFKQCSFKLLSNINLISSSLAEEIKFIKCSSNILPNLDILNYEIIISDTYPFNYGIFYGSPELFLGSAYFFSGHINNLTNAVSAKIMIFKTDNDAFITQTFVDSDGNYFCTVPYRCKYYLILYVNYGSYKKTFVMENKIPGFSELSDYIVIN